MYYTDNELNIKRWQGYLLYAVDGSTINLPVPIAIGSKDIKSHFGVLKNQHSGVVAGRISCRYDVLNHVAIHTKLGCINQSEKTLAIEQLKELSSDIISIYDRHYMSYVPIAIGIAFLHLFHKTVPIAIGIVIRCKLTFSNVIKDFVTSNSRTLIVDLKATNKAIKNLYLQGFTSQQVNKNSMIKVRLVKVILDNGEIESR